MEEEAFEILRWLVADVETAYPEGNFNELEDIKFGEWPDLAITYHAAKKLLEARDEMMRGDL